MKGPCALAIHPTVTYHILIQGWSRYPPPGKPWDYTTFTVKCPQPPANASLRDCTEELPCLFNIRADPCEHNNLAATMPAKLEQLKQRLNEYRDTAGMLQALPRCDCSRVVAILTRSTVLCIQCCHGSTLRIETQPRTRLTLARLENTMAFTLRG